MCSLRIVVQQYESHLSKPASTHLLNWNRTRFPVSSSIQGTPLLSVSVRHSPGANANCACISSGIPSTAACSTERVSESGAIRITSSAEYCVSRMDSN
jgi:hypothetical protein